MDISEIETQISNAGIATLTDDPLATELSPTATRSLCLGLVPADAHRFLRDYWSLISSLESIF